MLFYWSEWSQIANAVKYNEKICMDICGIDVQIENVFIFQNVL